MNIVLGTCFNYNLDTVYPFLNSLEDKFDGTVWLITDHQLNYQPKKFRLIIDIVTAEQLIHLTPVVLTNANNYRYFLYHNILKAHPEFTNIFLTDVRDVVFQTDPFAVPQTEKLVVCQEEKSILDEPYNSHWIAAVYGSAYLQQIGEAPVCCSGTILGKKGIMTSFLQDMCDAMILHGPRLDAGNNSLVIDQALFIDWVLKNEDLVQFNINASGSIFTMGHATSFCFNKRGLLVNQMGSPYAALHQYDRFPFLIKMLTGTLPPRSTLDQLRSKIWRSIDRYNKKT